MAKDAPSFNYLIAVNGCSVSESDFESTNIETFCKQRNEEHVV